MSGVPGYDPEQALCRLLTATALLFLFILSPVKPRRSLSTSFCMESSEPRMYHMTALDPMMYHVELDEGLGRPAWTWAIQMDTGGHTTH